MLHCNMISLRHVQPTNQGLGHASRPRAGRRSGGAFAAAAPAAAEDAPSDRSLACLAEAVYYEARGEPTQGRAAVAYVVLNRAESGKFPETSCAVVAEGCQFSYRCDGRPEALAVRADRDAAFATAKAVLTGAVADPTNGARSSTPAASVPGWFETRARVGKIGNHVFYR